MQLSKEPYPYWKELITSEGWKLFIEALELRKKSDWAMLIGGMEDPREIQQKAIERDQIVRLVDNYIKDFEFKQKEMISNG